MKKILISSLVVAVILTFLSFSVKGSSSVGKDNNKGESISRNDNEDLHFIIQYRYY